MKATTVGVEIALAVVIALVVLIVSPGIGVAAIIALIALVACGVSLLVARFFARRDSGRRVFAGRSAGASSSGAGRLGGRSRRRRRFR